MHVLNTWLAVDEVLVVTPTMMRMVKNPALQDTRKKGKK
jgi:predicted membrane GTPase involved in stress response